MVQVGEALNAASAKREVFQSLIFRISGMGLAFITTGILVRELGATNYGTWAALTSLLTWIQLSDFGVGYALKNRIASSSNPDEMFRLVSGVFQFYVLITMCLVVMFLVFGDFLSIVRDYRTEALLLYVGTLIFFPLTIGSAILQGMRKNSISSLFVFLQSIFWLLSVLFLAWIGISLLLLSLLNISLVLVLGIVQCGLGTKILSGSVRKSLVELVNFGNFRLALPLWEVGIRFIVLQLSGVILFSLGTYLTYVNLSPADAAKYDILFKFFQVPLTFFNVMISVYWAEIARSVAMKDRHALGKMFLQLHLGALCVSILMLIFSLFVAPLVVDIYSGGNIHILVSDALAFWALIMVQTFAYAGAVFLNAAEKLSGQIIFSVISAVLLIPIVLLLYAYGVGFSAVPIATAALIIPSLFYCNFAAYHHVIKNTG